MTQATRCATVSAVALAIGVTTMHGQAGQAALEKARALMKQAPLVDGHNDLPWAMRQNARYDFDKLDIRQSQPTLHTDIPKIRAGQLGGQLWSVYVPSSMQGQAAVTATLEQIDTVYELSRRYPDVFEIARTADDIERVFKAGKVASLVGMEGGHSIDKSLQTLRMMYRLGARYMTLTHSANVPWADSATDEPVHGGLSAFGETVVREMNYLGMLVDLSHVSPDTMRDALHVSEAPVIFSHSSARALCNVPRNVPDDVLKLVPKNGGVVMVTFVPGFVSQAVADWNARIQKQREQWRAEIADEAARKAAEAAWRAANPEPRATLAMVADHIDHVRKVAGVDHVGIGGDFDGIDFGPDGLENVSKYPDLVAELVRRGYTDDEVKKVIGLNVIRALREAEKVAARIQAARAPSVATMP
jgi:membrane dipeptidase